MKKILVLLLLITLLVATTGCSKVFPDMYNDRILRIAEAQDGLYYADDEWDEELISTTTIDGNGVLIIISDGYGMITTISDDYSMAGLEFYYDENYLTGEISIYDFYVNYINFEHEIYYSINFDGDGVYDTNMTPEEFADEFDNIQTVHILYFIEHTSVFD